jgi:hypothetical protein
VDFYFDRQQFDESVISLGCCSPITNTQAARAMGVRCRAPRTARFCALLFLQSAKLAQTFYLYLLKEMVKKY